MDDQSPEITGPWWYQKINNRRQYLLCQVKHIPGKQRTWLRTPVAVTTWYCRRGGRAIILKKVPYCH
jgi:hypothetical protein